MIALPQLLAGVLALTVGDVGAASDPPPQASPAPKPCATPQHRQFDFWLGDWDVTKPDGKAAGHNRITVILGGCALREEWTGASGTHGTSLNMFDAGARKWRQTWVDDGGTVLLLTGEFKGGRMVLEGDSPAAGGATVRQRISWTPQAGGKVRQLWESSTDAGKSWKVEFDGVYAKASPESSLRSHPRSPLPPTGGEGEGEGGSQAVSLAPSSTRAPLTPALSRRERETLRAQSDRKRRHPRFEDRPILPLQPLHHSRRVLGDHRPIVEGQLLVELSAGLVARGALLREHRPYRCQEEVRRRGRRRAHRDGDRG